MVIFEQFLHILDNFAFGGARAGACSRKIAEEFKKPAFELGYYENFWVEDLKCYTEDLSNLEQQIQDRKGRINDRKSNLDMIEQKFEEANKLVSGFGTNCFGK